MLLTQELLRIWGKLHQQLPLICWKGPVHSLLFYPDISARRAGDLDLLTHRPYLGEATLLLEELGYQQLQLIEDASQAVFHNADRGITIDLHWCIPREELGLKEDLAWETRQDVRLLGGNITTFSNEDLAVLSALNATKEYWNLTLHQLVDVAVILNSVNVMGLQGIDARARRLKCARPLEIALRLVDQHLPASLTEDLLPNGKADKRTDQACRELAGHMFGDSGFKPPTTFPDQEAYYRTIDDRPFAALRSVYFRVLKRLKRAPYWSAR